ncbi:MAG: N-acetyltransferase [Pontixanthobacter sp.]
MTAITIRPEAAGDETAIHALTAAAFEGTAHSNGNEPAIIDALRSDGDLSWSLVAETEDRLVGHIAFSPVTISDGTSNWYGLGPVSVLPELQGQRIGFRLVQRGIADMRQKNACGIVLMGDPIFYGRFGFEHDPVLTYSGAPATYFQRLVLDGDEPSGEVTYAKGFDATA